MNTHEIREAMDLLRQTTYEVEEEYIESSGEVTDSIDQKERQIAAIKSLLTGDGVDSLGRWLKAKEDEGKAIKAEMDHVRRRKAACDDTVDYIKRCIGDVLRGTDTDKVKGADGYSFSQFTSVKTSANKEVLAARYAERVEQILRQAGIPDYIGVTLTASSSLAAQTGLAEGDEELFETATEETCRFTKPRASKEA